MATGSKKKTGLRYDGKDSAPWRVVDQNGKPLNRDTHEGFATANAEAKRYTEMTGLHAGCVRV